MINLLIVSAVSHSFSFFDPLMLIYWGYNESFQLFIGTMGIFVICLMALIC